MTIHAYETDNGPNGMSWEVWSEEPKDSDRVSKVSRWIGSVSSRDEAEAKGATVFHTYAEWEAEQIAEEDERG